MSRIDLFRMKPARPCSRKSDLTQFYEWLNFSVRRDVNVCVYVGEGEDCRELIYYPNKTVL